MDSKRTKTCDLCFCLIEGYDIKKVQTMKTAPYRESIDEYTVCPHCLDRIETFMALIKNESWESMKNGERVIK